MSRPPLLRPSGERVVDLGRREPGGWDGASASDWEHAQGVYRTCRAAVRASLRTGGPMDFEALDLLRSAGEISDELDAAATAHLVRLYGDDAR